MPEAATADKMANERDFEGYYNQTDGGVAYGGAWTNKEMDTGEQVNELYFSGGSGEWVDEQGRTNQGDYLEGGMVKMGEDLGEGPLGLGWDAGAGTGSGGYYTNDSTSSVGYGANLVEGSVTMGSEQENLRLGLSAGGGMGGRLHHGDADGDGVMEAGFGVDYGFGSVDIKSETIGELVNMWKDPETDLPGAWW